MFILIMNGNPAPSDFDGYLDTMAEEFALNGHEVTHIFLRDKEIKYCTGCWTCWWGTPGLCAIRDGMTEIYPEMARADLVVWATPLVMGGPSALLKKAQDRFIPLAHPYIEIYKGECHHRHRYEHNADVALVVQTGPGDTAEDFEITRSFFERFSLNTKTSLKFAVTTDIPAKEAVNEALSV